MAGGDLNVAEVDPGVKHGGDVGVAEHVRVETRGGDPGRERQMLQAAGSSVPVHAVGTPVEQDWPAVAVPGGAFDGPRDGRWEAFNQPAIC